MMLRPFCAIFSLFIAAAGWYYMFYSRAANRLSSMEDAHINAMRVWLRKINGLLMFLLAISFFAGFFAVDLDHPTHMTAIVWLAVCGLVLALLALGLVDLRLTWRLRNSQRTGLPIDKQS
jgi:hypothetical protein